jgi:hypothetical protein
MNAVAYVRLTFSDTYAGLMTWDSERQVYIPTDKNFESLRNRTFTDDEIEAVRDGELLTFSVNREATLLEGRLQHHGRKFFQPWRIPMHEYKSTPVEFDGVTCSISYVHRDTGAKVTLDDVYFNHLTGEILQAIIGLST